jgi:hypothetical protein
MESAKTTGDINVQGVIKVGGQGGQAVGQTSDQNRGRTSGQTSDKNTGHTSDQTADNANTPRSSTSTTTSTTTTTEGTSGQVKSPQ